jgi:hypothetical protein
MVGWGRTINRFFRKTLKWRNTPKKLTGGIRKFIRKEPNDVYHKWHMSTNAKTGNRSLWSVVKNNTTQSGFPRIQRILTPKGIRYSLEGQKGFISTQRAKYLMGPSNKIRDPDLWDYEAAPHNPHNEPMMAVHKQHGLPPEPISAPATHSINRTYDPLPQKVPKKRKHSDPDLWDYKADQHNPHHSNIINPYLYKSAPKPIPKHKPVMTDRIIDPHRNRQWKTITKGGVTKHIPLDIKQKKNLSPGLSAWWKQTKKDIKEEKKKSGIVSKKKWRREQAEELFGGDDDSE